MDLLGLLLSGPRASRVTSLAELRALVAEHAGDPDTIARAAAAGLAADRVAYAFAGGYEAALARLVPDLPRGAFACLCATEQGGAHPRAIRTRFDGATLTGTKTFVTLGREADVLLVVATRGDGEDGRPRLVVARVPRDRPGLAMRDRPPSPVAPEIAHAEVTLDAVRVEPGELLPGDGYDGYLKPFRTIEDAHVLAAVTAHLIGLGRDHGWERAWIEEGALVVLALRAVAGEPPLRAEAHVALAGALARVRALVASAEIAKCDEPTRARFERDRALLLVAEGAREKRRDAAWVALGR
jgi:alkylation response protein AidB-like acyl-CoA dehydrogenase